VERRGGGSRGKPLSAASADSDGYLHVDLVGKEEHNRLVKLRFSTGIPARSGEAGGTQSDILEDMDFREKKLYHQIHPLKLATDIGVTPLSLYFVWEHRVLPALLIGFGPPLVVSLAMLKWTPDLEKLKRIMSFVWSSTPLGRLLAATNTASFDVSRMQSRRRMTTNGKMTLPYSDCLKSPRSISAIDHTNDPRD
jgi:hypothetical protein